MCQVLANTQTPVIGVAKKPDGPCTRRISRTGRRLEHVVVQHYSATSEHRCAGPEEQIVRTASNSVKVGGVQVRSDGVQLTPEGAKRWRRGSRIPFGRRQGAGDMFLPTSLKIRSLLRSMIVLQPSFVDGCVVADQHSSDKFPLVGRAASSNRLLEFGIHRQLQ